MTVSSIEDELIAYLDQHAADTATKARDIQIVAHFYGFDETPWPTLEATAFHFDINTRERVRQIIRDRFKEGTTLKSLPRAHRAARLLASRPFWFTSQFQARLRDELGEPEDLSLRGLLNLLHDLEAAGEYEIYDHNLSRVTRSAYSPDEDYVITTGDLAKQLAPALQFARKLPGQLGLSHSSYLRVKIPTKADRDRVTALIRIDPDAWVSPDEDDFWYCIETRENTLVTLASKVFATTKVVKVASLAEALCNGLRARSQNYEYPDAAAVTDWICGSRYFEADGEWARFIDPPAALTDIEQTIVKFLKKHSQTDYPPLKAHLEAAGFGGPHIVKAVTTSPIVHVDRVGGRRSYVYSLVGGIEQRPPDTTDDRYKRLLKRLKALEELGTDAPTETKARREQRLLTEWLFDGKATEGCAICGREFSIASLIAAHKKRRAGCTRAERLDPHIVMPLCLFGCDHLYERGLVWVKDGCVAAAKDAGLGAAEKTSIKALAGRRLAAEWLAGPASYFRPPRPAT